MTLFDDNRYDWRETYFVYFEGSHRPKLPGIRRALRTHAPFLSIPNTKTDPDGNLVEMTIASYEDHAALEIVYREGNEILVEAQNLVQSLQEDASEEERLQLQQIVQCQARFDIHHFEQTADTRVFNIVKVPELNFSKQDAAPVGFSDPFSKVLKTEGTEKGKFYFDPHSYEQCSGNRVGEGLDTDNVAGLESVYERINPEMLVTVLEVLCRISRGIALDPASGIVLE